MGGTAHERTRDDREETMTTRSNRSAPTYLSRRQLLKGFGLGVGAAFLGTFSAGLLRQAYGMETTRNIFLLGAMGQGIARGAFTPKEVDEGSQREFEERGLESYTWPALFGPLAGLEHHCLLVDNLSNSMPRGQHTGGYAALACRDAYSGANEQGGRPGGITIDQHIANGLKDGTVYPSVVTKLNHNRSGLGHFASGQLAPVRAINSAGQMYARLFSLQGAQASARSRSLTEALRGDLNKLRPQLAGPERIKLEHFESSLQEFDRRMVVLNNLQCASPGAPALDMDVDAEFRAMADMMALALTCGLTNVGALTLGMGHGHGGNFPKIPESAIAGSGFSEVGPYGHSSPEAAAERTNGAMWFVSKNLRVVLDALRAATLPEGGTLFDRTVMMVMSDNGDTHHSHHDRYPMLLTGGEKTGLKADGRYIRFEYWKHGGLEPGRAALADAYSSVATAVGVPTSDFGQGGLRPTQGVLDELMK